MKRQEITSKSDEISRLHSLLLIEPFLLNGSVSVRHDIEISTYCHNVSHVNRHKWIRCDINVSLKECFWSRNVPCIHNWSIVSLPGSLGDVVKVLFSSLKSLTPHHCLLFSFTAKPHWVQMIKDFEAAVEDNLYWECRASGKPKPSYRWLKNGEALALEVSEWKVWLFSEIVQKLNLSAITALVVPWFTKGLWLMKRQEKTARVSVYWED